MCNWNLDRSNMLSFRKVAYKLMIQTHREMILLSHRLYLSYKTAELPYNE